MLVDYKGITVAEDTALRVELRQNEVQYSVVKNTLARFALNNVGLEGLDEVLNGTTSLATSAGDPIAPMRVINKYAKQLGDSKFTIKGGFMDGKILSLEEIGALAELPAKDVLQAQALGMMLAPNHQPGHRSEGHRREGRRARPRQGDRCPRRGGCSRGPCRRVIGALPAR